ncbi:MAG: hypothetical protein CMF67_14140 [Magnetovibrio sp.]|nr:hypothetical protein [Magnetovibrio sp.]
MKAVTLNAAADISGHFTPGAHLSLRDVRNLRPDAWLKPGVELRDQMLRDYLRMCARFGPAVPIPWLIPGRRDYFQ